MEADEEGFLFPRIDQERCNDCGICRRTCPVNAAYEKTHGIVTDEDGSAVFIAGKAGLPESGLSGSSLSAAGTGEAGTEDKGAKNDFTGEAGTEDKSTIYDCTREAGTEDEGAKNDCAKDASTEDGNVAEPVKDEFVAPDYRGKRAFACRSKNNETRERSSSGGIFSELAAKTLEDGGVVFGAAFDSGFNVKHKCIDNIDDLDELRRSKYVQSEIGKAFREAEKHLKNDRKVLFCGTPCQIAGLKAYVGKEYEGLTACDLACFGVPSPKVWKMFLDYLKERYKSGISSVSFRDKSGGWRESRVNIGFENGSSYLVKIRNELYCMGFFKNLFTRRSCFDCRFKVHNSHADITLADFWGIEKLEGPVIEDDDRGISLVIAHTKAGDEALASLADRVETAECAPEDAVRYNPRLVSSLPEPAGRGRFFADMKKGFGFDRLRRKYMDNTSIRYRLKCIAKKILGRN
jgi:coenzyme F420-reducing hydrogenase beta subunit